MIEVTSVTALAVAKSVGTAVGKKFVSSVVEKWTKYRANRFFESYSIEVAKALEQGSWGDANQLTDQIFADDLKTELLFDSYRRVCFTKSKILGPRILGILTALLTLEGRRATEEEEIIFECAEVLADPEFTEIIKFYYEYLGQAQSGHKDVKERDGQIEIKWAEEEYDTTRKSAEFDIGSLDFTEALGEWARKAKTCSLLSDRILYSTRQFPFWDGEETRTEMKYLTYVIVKPIMRSLVGYIEKALAMPFPPEK